MKLSCIICAYNEAPRIGAVLEVVSRHPLIDEVIVVDDGSTDNTAEVVRRYPAVLVSQSPNQGKSRAMNLGIAAAQCDTVMLLDADLKGLTADNLAALAEPVVSGRADVAISIRDNSLGIYKWLGLDFVSGERVLPKAILAETADEIDLLPRFGLEVFTNNLIIKRKMRIAPVRWRNVTQARKVEKLGWWCGQLAELRMLRDVFKVIYPIAAAQQTYRMLKLRA